MNKSEEYNSFWSKFRANPSMYIGIPLITKLELFVRGFRVAEELIPNNFIGFDFKGFEKYIADKYNDGNKAINSFRIALRCCSYYEDRAFFKWFDWFDEYNKL